jgi:hypothetical protein
MTMRDKIHDFKGMMTPENIIIFAAVVIIISWLWDAV